MFAITQKDFGGPETLVWDKVADPRPEPCLLYTSDAADE